MEAESITIALSDESHGYAISPGKVPLAVLSEFAADVEAFVRGSGKEVDSRSLDVAIIDGSLALSTAPVYAPSLFRDLKMLREHPDLSPIDSKRRAIMTKWQAAAKNSLSWAIRIGSSAFDGRVVIDRMTDFRTVESETWLDVERYIQGELMDLGGSTKSNAHIKLPDGSRLTVKASRDLIRAETENLVYHTVHLRIKAKYNLMTGELRDASLIEFVDYAPKFDAAQFERFTANGKNAWGDIESPTDWVRTLRGSDE